MVSNPYAIHSHYEYKVVLLIFNKRNIKYAHQLSPKKWNKTKINIPI